MEHFVKWNSPLIITLIYWYWSNCFMIIYVMSWWKAQFYQVCTVEHSWWWLFHVRMVCPIICEVSKCILINATVFVKINLSGFYFHSYYSIHNFSAFFLTLIYFNIHTALGISKYSQCLSKICHLTDSTSKVNEPKHILLLQNEWHTFSAVCYCGFRLSIPS